MREPGFKGDFGRAWTIPLYPKYGKAIHVWLLDAPQAREGCRWFVVTLSWLNVHRFELRFKPVRLAGEQLDDENPVFDPDDHSAYVPIEALDTARWFDADDQRQAAMVVHKALYMIVEGNAELPVEDNAGESSLGAIVEQVRTEGA